MEEQKPRKFDDLDIGILRELRINCRVPMRELAQKLGSHPNTIMQRIKIMEKEEIIEKYIASISYRKLGYDIHVLMFMRVDKTARSEWDVLDALKKLQEFVGIYAITGQYDLVALVRTKNTKTLAEFIKNVNKIPHIMETQSSLLLETFKYQSEFNPLLHEGRNP